MRFDDLPATILTVRVRTSGTGSSMLEEQPVLSVAPSQTRLNEFEIRLRESLEVVRPIAQADIRRLNAELSSDRATLARLINRALDGSIELQIAFFAGECIEMGSVDIAVDEYVEAEMRRHTGAKDTLSGKRLLAMLDQRCTVHHAESAYFLMIAGPAIGRDLPDEQAASGPERDDAVASGPADPDEDSIPDSPIVPGTTPASQLPKPRATALNSFCVIGDGIRFVATDCPLADGKAIFTVTRLTGAQSRADRAVRLAKGQLRFVDWSKAGQIQILAREQLRALTKDEGSYLKKWDEFGNLEGECLLKRARDVGAVKFRDMHQNRDGTVTVTVAEASGTALVMLKDGRVEGLEYAATLPEYLLNQTLSFSEFVRSVCATDSGMDAAGKADRSRAAAATASALEVKRFDDETNALVLASEGALPSGEGTLIYSLRGEIAQVKRRMDARQAILEGRSANPQLGLLIEEHGSIAPVRRPPKIQPLTAFVRFKVFPRKPPTVMQERAIDIALNTPDIALIQGPPGTGKTTVIAAIIERLNELADKRGDDIRGRVLLTGFQHDAVENMIARMLLNGLPVPKFGKRSGREDDRDAFERQLEGWCAKVATQLREQNPQVKQIEQESRIRNLHVQYVQVPTHALALDLARHIASLGVRVLGDEVARWAAQVVRGLSRQMRINEHSSTLLGAVRSLRVRYEAFADDGPERATDAMETLREFVGQDEMSLLDRASLWRREDGPPAFLEQLAELKRELLIRFAAPPVFRVEKQNDDVVALANAAIERIRTAGHVALDAKSAALAELLAELDSNPEGMLDAVWDYSFAFAATCQQSVSRGMWDQKRNTREPGGRAAGYRGPVAEGMLEYDYVIVDEAARVSPRDLMIAAAQGKRIILVGDHRQLPHIIDEEIAQQMDAGETGQDESHWLKRSMFQYLFSERLKALEEHDGVQRRVTLDTQYRMHPLLGEFVSRNFYERFDRSEKFGSGRPSSDFRHDLPDTDGKPAAWLELPSSMGTSRKAGTSWVRPAEATAIAQRVQAWMASDAGRQLSFGVMSFYKAQAELIRSLLTTSDEDDRRLRIGTVDSFQGMEFDVVFLSMVRTCPQGSPPSEQSRERQARRRFGHLCLYNRLNVAMSRQIRLLVVAGDSALLAGDLAEEYVPGLVDFLSLCKAEGRVMQC